MDKKEYYKQYYEANKEKILERQKKYNKANKEKVRECEKQWRIKNKKKIREDKKRWYLENKEERKKYLEDNKELFKERRSKYYRTAKFKKYNISEEEYLEMFNNQNECCLICETPEEKLNSSLHIDHCHKTGKIRGLLCVKCNNGIGQFNDDIELMKKVIKYLKIND